MELVWQNETANTQPLKEFHSWISPEDAITLRCLVFSCPETGV